MPSQGVGSNCDYPRGTYIWSGPAYAITVSHPRCANHSIPCGPTLYDMMSLCPHNADINVHICMLFVLFSFLDPQPVYLFVYAEPQPFTIYTFDKIKIRIFINVRGKRLIQFLFLCFPLLTGRWTINNFSFTDEDQIFLLLERGLFSQASLRMWGRRRRHR